MIGHRNKFWKQLEEPKVKKKFIALLLLVVLYIINLFFFSWYMGNQGSGKNTDETGYRYYTYTAYI